MKEIPAHPGEECQRCDHFCLDPTTDPPFGELCFGRQSIEMLQLYLSFRGLYPRPLISEDPPVELKDEEI